MANQEHLEILKQGVEVWNKWREDNLDIVPDLSKADLEKADLPEVNFEKAILSNTSLFKANLARGNFKEAYVRKANLMKATLERASFQGADLAQAKLIEAYLESANLEGANARKARFQKAIMRKANFNQAVLYEADFTGGNLEFSDLTKTKLEGAEISYTNLRGANLIKSNLFKARLISSDLTKTNITGACLYGANHEEWKIDGIICHYIFFDLEGKTRTPKERDFYPGEFEERYKALPTFEYFFENGFQPSDILLMDKIVQAINDRHPEVQIELVSFDKRETPHATFTVLQRKNIEIAQKQLTKAYEKIKFLEGRLHQAEQPNQLVSQFLDKLLDTAFSAGTTEIRANQIKGLICSSQTGPITKNYEETQMGDDININGGRDVVFAKDHGRATINKTNSGDIINAEGIQAFTDQLKRHINDIGLEPKKRDELEARTREIEQEIRSPSPDGKKVNEYLVSIRNILEGAAGSLTASGLVYEIAKLI